MFIFSFLFFILRFHSLELYKQEKVQQKFISHFLTQKYFILLFRIIYWDKNTFKNMNVNVDNVIIQFFKN